MRGAGRMSTYAIHLEFTFFVGSNLQDKIRRWTNQKIPQTVINRELNWTEVGSLMPTARAVITPQRNYLHSSNCHLPNIFQDLFLTRFDKTKDKRNWFQIFDSALVRSTENTINWFEFLEFWPQNGDSKNHQVRILRVWDFWFSRITQIGLQFLKILFSSNFEETTSIEIKDRWKSIFNFEVKTTNLFLDFRNERIAKRWKYLSSGTSWRTSYVMRTGRTPWRSVVNDYLNSTSRG